MISNLAHFVFSSKLLSSACCFVGGYILNSILRAINRPAIKYLNLSIDFLNGRVRGGQALIISNQPWDGLCLNY